MDKQVSLQSLILVATALVTAFTGALAWLDKRTNKILKTAKEDLEGEITKLEERVGTLEKNNRLARGFLRRAYHLCIQRDQPDIAKYIEEAEDCLS